MTKLTFNKSIIWPDNSKIIWELDGIGIAYGKIRFRIRTTNGSMGEQSCFVSVMEYGDCQYSIEDSPVFWNSLEWNKIHKVDPKYAMKHQNHLARQAAMQWAEEYYETKLKPNS
jgi:hypothetical protein